MKLIPYSTVKKKPRSRVARPAAALGIVVALGAVLGGTIYSFPLILEVNVQRQEAVAPTVAPTQFPVTVDPQKKLIVENAQVNQLLESPDSPLQAAAANSGITLGSLFTRVAAAIANAPWYESIAAADAPRFVTIDPGMRKEQVATAFAQALGWSTKQKAAFETTRPYASLPLAEGSFSPGLYAVNTGMTPTEAQQLVNDRFTSDILSHYGTTTAQVVPLDEALTIASLIDRETGGPDDMRLISGIIWNRLFAGMDLQIDATLQYAKANASGSSGSWWPEVVPNDKYIKSAYNTYQHSGLPPTPIANPSVAAVIAALNPVNTSCLFYFHDANGNFHCSDTYAQHVALLKKYYGQGK